MDVTPTILALKGVPMGEDFDGAPMAQLFAEGWLEANPVRVVATHDTDQWQESRKARQIDAVDELERLEQLRSLGYIR
jgi:arylsulfatase A-like enzyme